MKKLSVLFFFVLMLSQHLFGQQVPQFSQYMFNPLFINPAYTGYKEQLYLQTYYRKQWTGVEGSPETFAIGADGYLPESRIGVGMVGVSDKIGAQRTNAVYGNIAYHLHISQASYLSFGMGIGLINSMLDGTALTTGNPNDPSIPAVKNNISYPDFKLGMFYYDDSKFFGIAVDNLISPMNESENADIFIDPTTHFYLTGGGLVELSPDIALRPTFMMIEDFNAPARLDLTASMVYKEKFWFGTTYRTALDYANRATSDNLKKGTAVVLLFEFFVKNGLRVGYAYDHNITGFNVRNFSTHDISIGYMFAPSLVRVVSPRHF
jgi:type IX secretion system PorP/SprF family membrane protein